MRAVAKVLLVNILVASALLLTVELGYRAAKFAASCIDDSCDRRYWALANKFTQNVSLGLSREHPTLGYVPNDGHFELAGPASKPAVITIRNGVRLNAGEDTYVPPGSSTLAVGDSFTFGSEVSDGETWPACLERTWNTKVVNGGVFGYGAAQAVLRARELEKEHPFDRIIWSILLQHDFERDRLVTRSDIVRPAVVSDGRELRYTDIQESKRIVRDTVRGGIARHAYLFGYTYTTELAWRRLSKLFLPHGTIYDGRWDITHPRAASISDLMVFAFDEFAKLQAREKYVLVQYSKSDFERLSGKAAAELASIRSLAAARRLPLIDSRAALKAASDRASLYKTHHTPAGNYVVCRSIVAAVSHVVEPRREWRTTSLEGKGENYRSQAP